MEYPLVDISEVESTKDRILLAAVKLFAEKGYAAVTVKDIAESVNVQPSALYNHFKSKEIIYHTIIESIENVYLDFYNRVDKKVENARCFEDVINALFDELIDVYHMYVYYGVALISTEQFRSENARNAFQNVYMKIGIDYSAMLFKRCVEQKWVKDFDPQLFATFFMNNILAGSLIRVQQDLGNKTVYDVKNMFLSLRNFMLNTFKNTDQPA